MPEQHYLVPDHEEGIRKDLDYSIPAADIEEAEDWFVDAKERLWDVNKWTQHNPATSARFSLSDAHGHAVGRHARNGDHIRIDMPEGPATGQGGDWVVIEAIEYDDYPDANAETFAMRVRPSNDPVSSAEGVSSEATSTFVIERNHERLTASYHGRNEITGWLCGPGINWQELIKGFVDPT